MRAVAGRSRRARFFAATALVFVSVIVSLVVAEVAVRVFFPQRLFYNVLGWDPDVGFVPIPNIRSVERNYEYVMTMQINSRGLRDREFPFEKPPHTFRIGVFGDSFTFGEGVESEQTFAKLLEQSFARDPRLAAAGWRVEVLNFGIGKTGTSHQLAWYRKEGVRYELDIVIVAFFSANDFSDNVQGVYRLSGGELVHDPAAYSSIRRIQSVVFSIPGYRWLAEHSHLVNIARRAGTVLNDLRLQARADEVSKSASAGQDAYAVELTRRLIETFAAEARANGSQFLMLSLPRIDQRQFSDFQGTEKIPVYITRLARLQASLKSSQIEWLDLVPVFARLPDKASYYYKNDGHWRPAGHEVVAHLLYQRLAGDIYAVVKAQ